MQSESASINTVNKHMVAHRGAIIKPKPFAVIGAVDSIFNRAEHAVCKTANRTRHNPVCAYRQCCLVDKSTLSNVCRWVNPRKHVKGSNPEAKKLNGLTVSAYLVVVHFTLDHPLSSID